LRPYPRDGPRPHRGRRARTSALPPAGGLYARLAKLQFEGV
jgi:hypothetical protein